MSKKIKLPVRVGKKLGRAVLDADGLEIVVFNKGMEDYAKLFCAFINNEHIKKTGFNVAYDLGNKQ